MPFIYLDIETDNTDKLGLDVFQSRIVTVQMLLPSGKSVIIKDPKNLDNIKSALENNIIVGHNIKFDAKFLKHHFNVTLKNVYDTMIAELVLSGGLYAGKKDMTSLSDLVLRYCGEHLEKEEQKGFKYGVPLTSAQQKYALKDLIYLPEIHKQQQAKIKQLNLETIIDLEMKAIPAMVWLELSGIKVDLEKLEPLKQNALQIKHEVESTIYHLLGDSSINLNSPSQLKKALNNAGIPVEGTNKDELKKYDTPVTNAILEYRDCEKFMNSFVDTLPTYINPITTRVHADYMQIGAVTGRLSCKAPNMQQQPARGKLAKHWKEIFVAEKGKNIVTADYSQIELRIVGQAAHDKKYIDAYNTPGVDLHKRTAATLFHVSEGEVTKTQRGMAKSVNFGLNYGMTGKGLIKKIKSDVGEDITVAQARQYIQAFQKLYPEVTAHLKQASQHGLQNKCVHTLAGRLIRFEDPSVIIERTLPDRIKQYENTHHKIPSPETIAYMRGDIRNQVLGKIGRQSKNYPIQGFCADLLKIALHEIFLKLEPLGVKFIATVHDEVVFECDENQTEYVKQVVKDEMERAGKHWFTDIPCICEVFHGSYWQKD
ncbi:DNA polymerase [Methanosarcina sp. UBA5]|uniref:DNA polymerase n=1 Tax=Methanosarcina sp. UBA5 TaxID=1915593 RepID=UPI0025FF4AAF|nr:DNA polymerase [Methanosarcina sp. UBA5]